MSLVSQLSSALTTLATAVKSGRTLINGNASDLTALTTTAKSNLVAAINEVKAAVPANPVVIDDVTASATKVYSSQKTNTAIAAAVAGVVASSPAALDTLNELAAALGNDANFASTVNTALGNRLKVDAAQALTAPQKQFGRDNLDVYSKTEIGDPATDFVAVVNAALA